MGSEVKISARIGNHSFVYEGPSSYGASERAAWVKCVLEYSRIFLESRTIVRAADHGFVCLNCHGTGFMSNPDNHAESPTVCCLCSAGKSVRAAMRGEHLRGGQVPADVLHNNEGENE